MPYAANGVISQDPVEGGIEITEQEYDAALEGVLSGKVIVVSGGAMSVDEPPSGEAEEPSSAPTIMSVIAERERRLSLGFDYDFGDARGVHHIGTSASDLKNWDEVTKLSQAAINLSQPDMTIAIETDDGPCSVTAMEWQHILIAAGAARQPIFHASFALQAMDPIPDDFENDRYW
jgi:hypothetical protein